MTLGFLTPLITEYLGPQRKRLVAALVYVDGRGRRYVVPAGFVFDGASVPRFLWALYPPFGAAYEPAACLHDYVYKNAELVLVDDFHGVRPINRGEADALLREAAQSCGFRGTGAAVMFAGVRAGGWKPWRGHRAAAAAVESAA